MPCHLLTAFLAGFALLTPIDALPLSLPRCSTLLTPPPRCVPRTWIGGRMLQNLVRHGMLDDALKEMRPFVDR